MEISKLFKLIEDAVIQNGKLNSKEALYKSPATSDYLARGRFCQRCQFYTEAEDGYGTCSLIGEVSEDATCRFFYGYNEGVREEPYIPILDIIYLEDNSIYLPLIKLDSTIKSKGETIYVDNKFINDLKGSALVDIENNKILYKKLILDNDILYAHLPPSILSILESNNSLLGIKLDKSVGFTLLEEDKIDSEVNDLTAIIILNK